MTSKSGIAIEFDSRGLRAVWGERDGRQLSVSGALLRDLPESVDADDAEAFGVWIGSELERAGAPRSKATIALSREHVVMKRLVLPTTDPHELPDMTRLALQRDLPFAPAEAVIDFIPRGLEEHRTTVLAVAVPRDQVERARAVVKAAGLGVDRITLRAMGASALVAGMPRETGNVLVVDVTREKIEFSAVVGRRLQFSRAADAPRDEDLANFAESLVTETRRTWLSYRITEGSHDVSRIIVTGDPVVSELAASPIGSMLRCDADSLRDHPAIDSPNAKLDGVWPLAGLILAPLLGEELINVAEPRRAPDFAAARRKKWLMAAGVAVIVLLGIWTVGRTRIADLRSQLASLEQRQGQLREPYARHMRKRVQLEHLERWDSVDVDWLDHADHLAGMLPAPDQLVLDGLVGTLDAGPVLYDKRAESNKWSVASRAILVVEGEAADRSIADGLRELLVASDIYRQSSAGADREGGRRLPFGFSYRLETREASPRPADDAGGGS